jgi:hypothetical protein
MKDFNITREAAEAAAAELGWTIDEEHFMENSRPPRKRGRPRKNRNIITLGPNNEGEEAIAAILQKERAEEDVVPVEETKNANASGSDGDSEQSYLDYLQEVKDSFDVLGIKYHQASAGHLITEGVAKNVQEQEQEQEHEEDIPPPTSVEKFKITNGPIKSNGYDTSVPFEVEYINIQGTDYLITTDGENLVFDAESEELLGEYNRDTEELEKYDFYGYKKEEIE